MFSFLLHLLSMKMGLSLEKPCLGSTAFSMRKNREDNNKKEGEKMAKKGGRPLKEINKKEFENLCGLQCTQAEICSWFDVTDKTLNAWCKRTYKATFSEVFKEKRGVGKIALRRYQFQQAEKNATMAIWLGKQWLGQSDQVHIQTQTAPVVIENDLEE